MIRGIKSPKDVKTWSDEDLKETFERARLDKLIAEEIEETCEKEMNIRGIED